MGELGHGARGEELDGAAGDMPGIRSDSRGVNGIAVNGVASSEGHGNSPGITQSRNHNKGQEQGVTGTDGAHDTPNGVLTNGSALSPAGGQAIPSHALHPFRELPPEILHITAGYQPLSRLIVRLAQDTFRNLTEVIGSMADMPMQQQTPQANSNHISNHLSTNGIHGRASNSIAKRQLLLDFGQERRAQFIKLLVLSQWSQKAAEVSKVIDLKVWLDTQRYLYNDAGTWLGEMKRNLAPARVPNPDLKTSLEVLSTGNASWLPDVRFYSWSSGLSDADKTLAWVLTARAPWPSSDTENTPEYQHSLVHSTKSA